MPDTLKVGTAQAKRGELKKGVIPGIELNITDRIDIPVMVMNGARDGPILLTVSTQHGRFRELRLSIEFLETW
jgi:hypothetical protein